jgi:hypothetical protein
LLKYKYESQRSFFGASVKLKKLAILRPLAGRNFLNDKCQQFKTIQERVLNSVFSIIYIKAKVKAFYCSIKSEISEKKLILVSSEFLVGL